VREGPRPGRIALITDAPPPTGHARFDVLKRAYLLEGTASKRLFFLEELLQR
jgi:hypothetical protein